MRHWAVRYSWDSSRHDATCPRPSAPDIYSCPQPCVQYLGTALAGASPARRRSVAWPASSPSSQPSTAAVWVSHRGRLYVLSQRAAAVERTAASALCFAFRSKVTARRPAVIVRLYFAPGFRFRLDDSPRAAGRGRPFRCFFFHFFFIFFFSSLRNIHGLLNRALSLSSLLALSACVHAATACCTPGECASCWRG